MHQDMFRVLAQNPARGGFTDSNVPWAIVDCLRQKKSGFADYG
jgi:hypothetical protein